MYLSGASWLYADGYANPLPNAFVSFDTSRITPSEPAIGDLHVFDDEFDHVDYMVAGGLISTYVGGSRTKLAYEMIWGHIEDLKMAFPISRTD